MARGKQTCKILKEIRRQIAEANGIELITSECRYKSDCLGTCPKCEAEVRYLEQHLRARSLAGKAVALAGISAGAIAMLMPITSDAQTPNDLKILPTDSIAVACFDSLKVKGTVLEEYTNSDGTTGTVEMIGAVVLNLTNGKGTATNIDGKFEIDAQVGDTIQVSFVGFKPKTVTVTDIAQPITVTLDLKVALLGEVAVVKREIKHFLDLNVIDEKGNPIETGDLYIDSPRIYEDGREDTYYIHPEYIDKEHPCRIYWVAGMFDDASSPLKEIILRIEAEGYDDPVIIKVKYPKRNAKKTIKFKHKKQK